MSFVSLLINLRDSLLSLQYEDTKFLLETFFLYTPYPFAKL